MAAIPEAHPLPDSLRELMTALIDYAGLFPPAGLPMQQAVENYSRYLQGEHSWALGRFVLPIARMGEFQTAQEKLDLDAPWRLSVLPGADLEADLRKIDDLNSASDSWALVDTIEAKVATVSEVQRIAALMPRTIQPYYEVPFDCGTDLLRTIHESGGRAKIRTGGVTAEAFPTTEAVARFIADCAKVGIAFKATAGLHHPVRCVKPLTHGASAPIGAMHGFLNVFLASAFAFEQSQAESRDDPSTIRVLQAILQHEDAAGFRFGNDFAETALPSAVAGKGNLELRISDHWIRRSRELFAISFGSCSFEEPIQDLRSLRFL